jgi:integrase
MSRAFYVVASIRALFGTGDSVGHVRKLSTGKYQARYRGPNGREHARNFDRKLDASAWLLEETRKVGRGSYTPPRAGEITLRDWSETYLAKLQVKPKTQASYESLIRSRILPALGDHRLSKIRPGDVDDWVSGMVSEGLSPSRIRQAHVVLSKMLKLAIRRNILAINAADGCETLPKIKADEADFFADPTIVDRIAQAADEWKDGRGRGLGYGLFIRLQGTLGLRFGEAAALRRRSVDLLAKPPRLHITENLTEIGGRLDFGTPKSHATRWVPLTPDLAAAERLRPRAPSPASDDALLFTSPGGSRNDPAGPYGDDSVGRWRQLPVRYSNFRTQVWVPIIRGLGLPPTGLHILRHTAAAQMISAGWTPKAIQRVLGHRSVAFTLTVYGHLFESDLGELAARLDERPADSVRILSMPSPAVPAGKVL